jgi:hypothetical protein
MPKQPGREAQTSIPVITVIQLHGRLKQQNLPSRLNGGGHGFGIIINFEEGIGELHEGMKGLVTGFFIKPRMDDTPALNVDFAGGEGLVRDDRDENVAAIETKELNQILEFKMNQGIGLRHPIRRNGGRDWFGMVTLLEVVFDFRNEPGDLKRLFQK